MPIYSTKDLEALFTIQEESTEERMERLRYRGGSGDTGQG